MKITKKQLRKIVSEAKGQINESLMSAEEMADSALGELFDAYLEKMDFDQAAGALREFAEGIIEQARDAEENPEMYR